MTSKTHEVSPAIEPAEHQPVVPVAVTLRGVLADEVTAFAETEAGWQVVGVDGPPRPALVLCDAPHADLPSFVLVDGEADSGTVRGHLVAGAVDVIAWPGDRERLLTAPLRVRRTPSVGPGGLPILRLAGAAGGVGTSTLVLAAAGLLAWSGRKVLAVGGDDLLRLCGLGPWSGPGAVELAALDGEDAGAEVAALRREVPGVEGLYVLGGGGLVQGTDGWPVDAVVVDGGQALTGEVGLVCARPDVSLARVAGSGRRVVVNGDGPLDHAGVKAALGFTPAGWLPPSARVARAACKGRVPSGLPGTWLRAARTVIAGVTS